MLIRAMQGSDLNRVLAIAEGLPTAPQWSRLVYSEAISSERRVSLVADDAGYVVGFLVAGILAPEAELESIAVDSAWQARGVGSGLLAAFVAKLKVLGVEALMLEVRASNSAAMRFYLRAGFTEAGRRRGYYSQPVEDAVLLGLRLG